MLNPIFTSYQQSDLIGKLIFILLFAASITTWTLFLKKFFFIRETKKIGLPLISTISKKLLNPMQIETSNKKNSFHSLLQTLHNSAIARLQKNSSEEEKSSFLGIKDLEVIEDELMVKASEELKKIEKNLFILSTIVSLAPFLGLLGTVWGILITFIDLQTNSGLRGESAMMGGLAMALATTVVGLVVAIPALIGYNYLKSQLSQLTHEMYGFGQKLVSNLGHYYCRIEK